MPGPGNDPGRGTLPLRVGEADREVRLRSVSLLINSILPAQSFAFLRIR